MRNNERLQILLSRGYFPRELPNVFTSHDFGVHSTPIITEWLQSKLFSKQTPKYKGRRLRGSAQYKIAETDAEIISTPKKNFERRFLSLTHPLPQALLAKEISENWRRLSKILSRRAFSIDDLQIYGDGDRPFRPINYTAHDAKKEYISSLSEWIVQTDVSRFYPTIYTHSFAWAAYGKEQVKTDRQRYTGSLADRLDQLVRACNRNQTIGIPIGPDTSRILAELISSDLDQSMIRMISPEFGDRLQDDWTIGAASLERAEHILSHLQKSYRSYGLEINGSKTSIEYIAQQSDHSWVSELGSFLTHVTSQIKGQTLYEFLKLAIRLQVANPGDPVINYVLAILEGHNISTERDIERMESFLLKAVILAPGSLDRICRISLNLHYRTQRISLDRIGNRFTQLFKRFLMRDQHFEAIWTLFTLRGLRYQIRDREVSDMLAEHAGSIIPLIALDMDSMRLFPHGLPKDNWASGISSESIRRDSSWLLAYEGCRRGWLQDKTGVLNSKLFAPLLAHDVEFYDPRRNVTASERVRSSARLRRREQARETALLNLLLRGRLTRVRFSSLIE